MAPPQEIAHPDRRDRITRRDLVPRQRPEQRRLREQRHQSGEAQLEDDEQDDDRGEHLGVVLGVMHEERQQDADCQKRDAVKQRVDQDEGDRALRAARAEDAEQCAAEHGGGTEWLPLHGVDDQKPDRYTSRSDQTGDDPFADDTMLVHRALRGGDCLQSWAGWRTISSMNLRPFTGLALLAAIACSGGGSADGKPTVVKAGACGQPDAKLVAAAVPEFIRTAQPRALRYLVPATSDTSLPEAGRAALQMKGQTFLYPNDTAQRTQIINRLSDA